MLRHNLFFFYFGSTPTIDIEPKFKKGTVNFVPDAVKPMHLLGNIYFYGFDIYGML